MKKLTDSIQHLNSSKALEEWRNRLVDSTEANKHYVELVGIFTAGASGHLGAYKGHISDYIGFDIIESDYIFGKLEKKKQIEKDKRRKEMKLRREVNRKKND